MRTVTAYKLFTRPASQGGEWFLARQMKIEVLLTEV